MQELEDSVVNLMWLKDVFNYINIIVLHQCNNCQPSKGAPQYAVCTIRASPS